MTKAEMKRAAFALSALDTGCMFWDEIAKYYGTKYEYIEPCNPRAEWTSQQEGYPKRYQVIDFEACEMLEASILLSEACS